MKKVLWVLALISFQSVAANTIDVKVNDYKEWPFTVEYGALSCLKDSSILFISNGKKYALNGVASSMGYKSLEEIWKYDSAFLEWQKSLAESEGKSLEDIQKEMGGTPRVSIGEILKSGLSLCS